MPHDDEAETNALVGTSCLAHETDDDEAVSKPERSSHANNVVNYQSVAVVESETTTASSNNKSGNAMISTNNNETSQVFLPVIQRMPNTAFGVAMGLAGEAIMCKAAFTFFRLQQAAYTFEMLDCILWIAALVVFVLLLCAYAYKALYHFALVKDEFDCAVRVHFFNCGHLTLLMLVLGVPTSLSLLLEEQEERTKLQIFVWLFAFTAQTLVTLFIYEGWMFSPTSNISLARPQFLLSTVGWFLLSIVALQIQEAIESEQQQQQQQQQQAGQDSSRLFWAATMAAFCFGAGSMLYVIVTISIFNGLHSNRHLRGSPALFLLMAPPSVGVNCLQRFHIQGMTGTGDESSIPPQTFSIAGAMVLGWCLLLFLLLLKVGPQIARQPPVLGTYWAYVFPLSALATAMIGYAKVVHSALATSLAVLLVLVAIVALIVVVVRMVLNIWLVVTTPSCQWGDPLLQGRLEDHGDNDQCALQSIVL